MLESCSGDRCNTCFVHNYARRASLEVSRPLQKVAYCAALMLCISYFESANSDSSCF